MQGDAACRPRSGAGPGNFFRKLLCFLFFLGDCNWGLHSRNIISSLSQLAGLHPPKNFPIFGGGVGDCNWEVHSRNSSSLSTLWASPPKKTSLFFFLVGIAFGGFVPVILFLRSLSARWFALPQKTSLFFFLLEGKGKS